LGSHWVGELQLIFMSLLTCFHYFFGVDMANPS
jgi:hypothetical protein